MLGLGEQIWVPLTFVFLSLREILPERHLEPGAGKALLCPTLVLGSAVYQSQSPLWSLWPPQPREGAGPQGTYLILY